MIISFPILLALGAMIAWGFEELFLKEAISKLKSLTLFLINSLTGIFFQLIIILIFFSGEVYLLTGEDLLYAILATIVAFTGYFFFYLALERQELSLISSLDESWIIVAVLIGVFFFGETLGFLHIASILAVLFGAFLISVNMADLKKLSLISGSGYEFVAVFFGETLGFLHIASILAVLFGAFLISVNMADLKKLSLISGSGYEFVAVLFVGMSVPIEKFLIHKIGEANTIFYLGIFTIPLVFAAKIIMRGKFVRPNWKLLKIGIAYGLADGIAFVLYLLALKGSEVSVVSPIVASSLLVSIFLAKIYLREKMTKKEVAGALLIFIGVIVLSTLVPF